MSSQEIHYIDNNRVFGDVIVYFLLINMKQSSLILLKYNNVIVKKKRNILILQSARSRKGLKSISVVAKTIYLPSSGLYEIYL